MAQDSCAFTIFESIAQGFLHDFGYFNTGIYDARTWVVGAIKGGIASGICGCSIVRH